MPQKTQDRSVQEEWQQVLGVCRIVWGGILFMLALFTYYTHEIYLPRVTVDSSTANAPNWIWILQAMGLVTFVFAISMTRWILPRWLRTRSTERPSLPPIMKLSVLTICSLSLLQVVGFYGLIIALSYGMFEPAYPFLLAAFVGLFMRFPQRHVFEEVAKVSTVAAGPSASNARTSEPAPAGGDVSPSQIEESER